MQVIYNKPRLEVLAAQHKSYYCGTKDYGLLLKLTARTPKCNIFLKPSRVTSLLQLQLLYVTTESVSQLIPFSFPTVDFTSLKQQHWWSRVGNADGALSNYSSLLSFRNIKQDPKHDVCVYIFLCVFVILRASVHDFKTYIVSTA